MKKALICLIKAFLFYVVVLKIILYHSRQFHFSQLRR